MSIVWSLAFFKMYFCGFFLHITISSYEFGCLEFGRPYVFRNRNDASNCLASLPRLGSKILFKFGHKNEEVGEGLLKCRYVL
jgi:hypothetical protein